MEDTQKIIDKIVEAENIVDKIITVNKDILEHGNNRLFYSYQMGLKEIREKLEKGEKINSSTKEKWNKLMGASPRFLEGHSLEVILNDIDEMLNNCPLVEKTFFDKFMKFFK